MDRKQLEDVVIEDFEYFKKQVEKGIRRLAGDKTNERERLCFHCKLWNRSDKFIKEIAKLGEIEGSPKANNKKFLSAEEVKAQLKRANKKIMAINHDGYCSHGKKHSGLHTCDGCCAITPKAKEVSP